jgi:PIN domain nuclease of toxin-antitoxin system
MLVFILLNTDEINYKVSALLKESSAILYASSVAVKELLLLFRLGKLRTRLYKSGKDILIGLQDYNIEIVYFNQRHLATYSSLHITENHKDMNDHSIIAQAISDKITLISSDHTFEKYTPQGLNFIYNKR